MNLYFTDPDASTPSSLIPSSLPIRDRFETTLVDRLLQGPTAACAGASVPVSPRTPTDRSGGDRERHRDGEPRGGGGRRERGTTSSDGRTASRDTPTTSRRERRRVQVAGADVRLPGVSQPMPRDAWPTFDTDVVAVEISSLRSGTTRRIRSLADEGGVMQRARRGRNWQRRAALPAMGLAGDNRVAGLDADDTNLLVGPLAADQPITTRLSAPDLTAPSWDGTGAVWVASGPAAGPSRAWVIRDGQQAVAVELPTEITSGRITALRVARDGARLAAVVVAAQPQSATSRSHRAWRGRSSRRPRGLRSRSRAGRGASTSAGRTPPVSPFSSATAADCGRLRW